MRIRAHVIIVAAVGILLGQTVQAAGLLKPKDSPETSLQIRSHRVEVTINNGFAVTEVDQVFYNPFDRDLEAVYTFPLPRDASLSELSLWIDGQEVMGEVVEKKEARRLYEEERSAGRETALAEQREYHAFDVQVHPVRAGQETRVRLVYLQPLEIDTGVGRYVYPLEEGRIDEEMHSFWDVVPAVHGTFEFLCTLKSSYPVDAVRLKGYESEAEVGQNAPDTWTVRLSDEEGGMSLDQDLVVYYRLADDLPARVDLMTHRDGDGPGTFLLTITPGADLQPIREGVDWMVVLDLSGSMGGKIQVAADAVARAIETMRPEDRFRVVGFAQQPVPVIDVWTPVTPDAVDEARRRLMSLRVQGGTNLYAGFKAGLDAMEADRTSALLVVSDGGANVGPTQYTSFRDLLDRKDVRVFTFVMGQGANRPLLGRLAEESGGFSMDVSNQDDLYGRVMQAREKLGREALHGVTVELEGAAILDRAPERLATAYHGQQITLFGRYARPATAKLRLHARISGAERAWESEVQLPDVDTRHPELERLWALSSVQDLQQRLDDAGNDSELRQAIVDLGTGYSIVTEHTSMVVMREAQFEERGIDRSNRERVEKEREARLNRQQQVAIDTRADRKQPMFPERRAPRIGDGGGAVGPGFVALLGGLLGARAVWGRRRRKR